MGACYSTEFKLKFKPNGGLTEATEKLNEYFVNELKCERRKSVYDLLVYLLSRDKWSPNVMIIYDGSTGYIIVSNDYNHLYMHEEVLQDVFEVMAPFLENGSYVYISPDNDWYKMTIINGEVDYDTNR